MNIDRQQAIQTLVGLQLAQALLSDEKNWTKHALARDSDEVGVWPPYNKNACQWSTIGAVDAVIDDREPRNAAVDILDALARRKLRRGGDGIVEYNDRPKRAHKEVIYLFDEAIEIAASRIQ